MFIWLFGSRFEVDGITYKPLAGDARFQIAVVVNGPRARISIKAAPFFAPSDNIQPLDAEWACTIAGDELKLGERTQSQPARCKFAKPFGQVGNGVMAQLAAVPPDLPPTLGIVIKVKDRNDWLGILEPITSAVSYINRLLAGASSKIDNEWHTDLYWTIGNASASLHWAPVPGNTHTGLLSIAPGFGQGTMGQPSISVQQVLGMQHAVFDGATNTLTIDTEVERGARQVGLNKHFWCGLLVNTDIFDPDALALESNHMLAHQLLVNGMLRYDFTYRGDGDPAPKSAQCSWQPKPNSHSQLACLVSFGLTDEFGLPVVLLAPSFPLISRTGVIRKRLATQYELSNASIQIGERNGGQIKVEVCSINPESVNIDAALPEPRHLGWLFRNGELLETASPSGKPRELHGFASGSYLRWSGTGSWQGTIECEACESKPNLDLPSFIFARLSFDRANLALHIQTPERQLSPLAADGKTGIGVSEMTGAARDDFALPLSDYHYALVNRSNRSMATPGLLNNKNFFLERAASWLDELNLIAATAFNPEENASQQHHSGFAKFRTHPRAVNEPLLALFSWPAGEARVSRAPLSALDAAAPHNPLAVATRGSPVLAGDTAQFMHGGTARDDNARVALEAHMNAAGAQPGAYMLANTPLSLGDMYERFAVLWSYVDSIAPPPGLTLAGAWPPVREGLREVRLRAVFGKIAQEFPPVFTEPDPLIPVVAELRRIIRGHADMNGFNREQVREFESWILQGNQGVEVFEANLVNAAKRLRAVWVAAKAAGAPLVAFLSTLIVPPTRAVFTLALEALLKDAGTIADFKALAAELPGYDVSAVTGLREIGAMLTTIADGLPGEVAALEKLWSDKDALKKLLLARLPAADIDIIVAEVNRLRLAYGTKLAASVYARVLASEQQLSDEIWHLFIAWSKTCERFSAYPLFEELRTLWNKTYPAQELENWQDYATGLAWDFQRIQKMIELKAGANFKKLALQYLAALRFEPPEYLLFSGRLPQQAQPDEKVDQLWNHAFPVSGQGWNFMLDSKSTIIVKLTEKRKMGDLLREAARANTSPAIPDPLGVVVGMEAADEALARLINVIDPEVSEDAAWRGVFVIRPTLDLAKHQQMCDLLGMRHFEMEYVAIGGRAKDGNQALNTYAYVKHLKPQEAISDAKMQDAGTDIGMALVKFEAQIRNATLVSGEVILNLYITNLWGKTDASGASLKGEKVKASPRIVVIKGTVPQGPGAGAFEFTADLPTPIDFDINVAFIERFSFKGMKIGTHDGNTAIEIDGSLQIKPWEPYIPKGSKPIGLQDFRILIPRIEGGEVTKMGANRFLQFDFPSIHIPFPGAKAIKLGTFMDIRPEGVGFIRDAFDKDQKPPNKGKLSPAYDGLLKSHVWLFANPPASGLAEGTVVPYAKFSVSFGKLPQFGGTSLASLRFDMLIGIVKPPGNANATAIIGISSLDASKLSIDVFGIIKLYLEQLFVGGATYGIGSTKKEATIIAARKARLAICGWEPFESLNLVLAQYDKDGSAHSAFLATATAKEGGGATVKLDWIVLGRNIELDERSKNYLLEPDKKVSDPDKLFQEIVALPPTKEVAVANGPKGAKARVADGATINVDLGADGAWLFAVRGKIGKFIEDGVLVLHDQRYYGIRLRGELVKALIGKDTLHLAYIPGPTRDQDRFRTSFRIPALSFIVGMEAGEFGIEWGFNWSFLLDFFFPWKRNGAYLWERAARMPMGTYEAKFGFYFERRVTAAPQGAKYITLGAGVAFYAGYYWGMGSVGRGVWVRAGIGVFAILEGAVTMLSPDKGMQVELLRTSIERLEVTGVVGIYAYAEGGLRIWILSATIIASVQAAIAAHLLYIPKGGSTLSYLASMAASYEASCSVGSGFFSWTFSVSGEYSIEANGTLCLS